MENKHIKDIQHSISLRNLKTAMTCHYRLHRISKGQITDKQQIRRRQWNNMNTHSFRKQELNILITHNPAVTLFSIYQNEWKMYAHTKTHIWMFIATLFIITKAWKQPVCSLASKLRNSGTHQQWNIVQY